MKIAVVIVTHHRRNDALIRCLDSLKLLKDKFNSEVRLVINGQDQSASEIAKSHELRPLIHVVHPAKTPAHCRNLALNDEGWDWAFFLDDDAYISSDYLTVLSSIFKLNQIPEVFGGPDLAYIHSTSFQKAVGIAQQSPLATSITRFRHADLGSSISLEEKGVPASENKLILCNLWVKRTLWEKVGGFDARFMRNEENIWLDKAGKYSDAIFYFNKLFVYHSKKNSFKDLYFAVFRSAYYRIKSTLLTESKLKPIYLAPLVFFIYFIILMMTSSINLYLSLPIILYAILNLLTSIFYSQKNQHRSLTPLVMVIQFFILISYGIGSLWGVFGPDPKSDR